MADQRISELTNNPNITGTEEKAVERGGANYKQTLNAEKAFILSDLNGTDIPLLPGTTNPTVAESIADLEDDLDTKVQSITGDGVGGTVINPTISQTTSTVNNNDATLVNITGATQYDLNRAIDFDLTQIEANKADQTDLDLTNGQVLNNTVSIGSKADQTDLDLTNAQVLINTQDKVGSVTTGEPTGSDKVVNMVSLTQAEYDAGTPIATTFYLITS